jgi:hypothetical protein
LPVPPDLPDLRVSKAHPEPRVPPDLPGLPVSKALADHRVQQV